MTSPTGWFASPNYPNNYDNNVSVCWLISTPNPVNMWFTFFETEYNRDYVNAYAGDSTYSPTLLYQESGSYKKGDRNALHLNQVSSINRMLVTFTSDEAITYRGFNASYSSCSVLASYSGTISSPNYPSYYSNSDSVCWIINAPVGYFISLWFSNFSTEERCDYVRVFKQTSTINGYYMFNYPGYSGNIMPYPITTDSYSSDSKQMLIIFSSDSDIVFQGFQASYMVCYRITTIIRIIEILCQVYRYSADFYCYYINNVCFRRHYYLSLIHISEPTRPY